MAKSKNITMSKIIEIYMGYVLENESSPKSVYAFAKSNKFEESAFYNHFGSFDAIDKVIFKTFFDNTMETLSKSKEYQTFDTRNKLLSFYFTFFENLTANRSYILILLNNKTEQLKNLTALSYLKTSFSQYINELNIETIDFKQKSINQIQQKGIQESAWLQLLLTIHFWKNDSSALFEKTDIFIEKSVNTSFDLLNTTPLKSMIDLGKFFYKEKINFN
jgi:hypothetical protein